MMIGTGLSAVAGTVAGRITSGTSPQHFVGGDDESPISLSIGHVQRAQASSRPVHTWPTVVPSDHRRRGIRPVRRGRDQAAHPRSPSIHVLDPGEDAPDLSLADLANVDTLRRRRKLSPSLTRSVPIVICATSGDRGSRCRRSCAKNNRLDAAWRRGWDSNPRYACTHNGFRDRPDRPLRHLSKGLRRPVYRTAGQARQDGQGNRLDRAERGQVSRAVGVPSSC